jgi:cell division protein FtsB
MASFGKKKKLTDYLYSRPVLAVLGIVVILTAFAVYQRFVVEREMAARRMEVEKEKQELIQRKAELEEKVEYLSGERGIEEEIRKHFDVAKEGEQVVIIVDKEVPDTAAEVEVKDEKPWYQFW